MRKPASRPGTLLPSLPSAVPHEVLPARMHLLQVIVEFLIVLGFMVLVHEFGHFAMAKAFRVRVEAFAIGFGTRLFGVEHGGTDYRLNLLPFGGYVKFAGDQPGETASDPGDFNAHPRWQRVFIALAGPVANFILAFALFFLAAHFHHEVSQYLNGPAVVDYVAANTPAMRDGMAAGDTILSINGRENPTWFQVLEESALASNKTLPLTYSHNGKAVRTTITTPPMDSSGEPSETMLEDMGFLPRQQQGPIAVETVAEGTPAEQAGLRPGDKVARIDGLTLHSVPTLLAYLKDRNGAPAVLTVERGGQTLQLPVVPKRMPGNGGEAGFRIGFSTVPMPSDVVRLPFGSAVRQAWKDSADNATLILRVLKGMFTRDVAVKSVSGPVGMAQMIDVAARNGYWTLVGLMSMISINLGILNLLPFPVLDGGMILFLVVEALMRRDVNQVIKERVYQVAFVCLILVAVLVMFNDISKLHFKP